MKKPAFTIDEGWLEFHPSPSVPEFRVPPGAVDAHCHVFGPCSLFPFSPQRKYTPCDAPKDKLWALRRHLGFERNVLVQATCHGKDNRALVDALLDAQGAARGVAMIHADISDKELDYLNKAGVRGIRFNFVKRLGNAVPKKLLFNIADRVKAIGWHIVIYFEASDLPELFTLFSDLPTEIVIDHMGRPDVTRNPAGKEFGLLLQFLEENPNAWAKVGCPERLSQIGPPRYDDVVPFARKVVQLYPDRVLWGTDWPHPNMSSHMPDDGKLVDFIPKIAVTEELQNQLLVNNPMRLYWPEELDQ